MLRIVSRRTPLPMRNWRKPLRRQSAEQAARFLLHHWGRRILGPIGGCVVMVAFAQSSALGVASESLGQEGRWLLAIETSADMAPRREALMITLEKLLLSGFDQRLQPGDTIGVWTFDHQVTTGQFPLQTWYPGQGPKIADMLREFLQTCSWQHRGEPALVPPLAQIVARQSARFNLLLFCSGERPLAGTPFDESVNRAVQAIRRQQRRLRQPVVIVLRAENGDWKLYTIGQPPWPVEIPALPYEQTVSRLAALRSEEPESKKLEGPPLAMASAKGVTDPQAASTRVQEAVAFRHASTNAADAGRPDPNLERDPLSASAGKLADSSSAPEAPLQTGSHRVGLTQAGPPARLEDADTQKKGEFASIEEPARMASQDRMPSTRTEPAKSGGAMPRGMPTSAPEQSGIAPPGSAPVTQDSVQALQPVRKARSEWASELTPATGVLSPAETKEPSPTGSGDGALPIQGRGSLPDAIEPAVLGFTASDPMKTAQPSVQGTAIPASSSRSKRWWMIVSGLLCILCAVMGWIWQSRHRSLGSRGSLITQSMDRQPPSDPTQPGL